MLENPSLHTEKISQAVKAASDALSEASAKIQEAELHLRELTVSIGNPVSSLQSQETFFFLLTVFVLSCFIGYYVIWKVTPALHSPLMSVTNAISSVIIVGALIAAGPDAFSGAKFLGFLAVFFASVNIFGGFVVTERMLSLFKNKQQKE